MVLQALAFYLFSGVAILAGLAMISARNPVHSVLFLILAFFNGAGLFILLGAEFLGLLLIVVYVGAVAVLFLFVVMMLDIDFVELRQGFQEYLPIGSILGLLVVLELIFAVAVQGNANNAPAQASHPIPAVETTPNIEAIGLILYTDYFFLFQTAGMILLVAMIGAIVLTHRKREGVRRQVIADQVNRDPATAMELKDIKPGQGL